MDPIETEVKTEAGSEAAAVESTGAVTETSSPPAETGAQPAGGGETGEVKTPPAGGEAEGVKEDWRDKRIAKLTARLKAEQEAKTAAPQAEETPSGLPLDPTADFNRRVTEAANAQLAAKSFADACNAAAAEGKKKFGDAEFTARLNALRGLVTTPEETQAYQQFLQAGVEAGDLHQIIYDLGGDLNEAERVLSLSPIKMAVELAKRAVTRPAEPVSKVPRPLTHTLGGQRGDPGFVDPADPSKADGLDTEAWMKAREAQVAKATGR